MSPNRPITPPIGRYNDVSGNRVPILEGDNTKAGDPVNQGRPFYVFHNHVFDEMNSEGETAEEKAKNATKEEKERAYFAVKQKWKGWGIWPDRWDENLVPDMEWEYERMKRLRN
ncbi:unnamed protein product [Clonostachys rosea]|uniref:Uncharacterized protein n=1 Tax=Bionectria ochroleuca TaxID=29856 RepID=A0ABY6TPN5_BIOOC|nr:unnamed protein product [Clonostachys rosea]